MPELKLPSTLSALQQRVLEIVCTHENVTYKKLIRETRRDRITILQSVESLVKQNYIIKQRLKPEFEKSIIIFKPTGPGKSRAAFIQNVNLEGILRMEKDKDIDNYLEVIKDVTDASQREMFIQPLQVLFARPMSPAFYETVIRQQAKKNDLKKSLRDGVLQIIRSDHYDAGCLFNKRTIRPLKDLLGPSDILELKCLLSKIRNNADKTIERLPD
ncbi:MAG: hypothetical protein WA941_18095 [Nitrososphaeraceae archaeon]